MTAQHEGKALSDILKVVLHHRRLFLIGAALFSIGVFAFAHTLPLSYTVTAMFEHRTDPLLPQRGESFQAFKRMLHHELAGPKAVERVLDDLGLTRDLARNDDGTFTEPARTERQTMARALAKNIHTKWHVRSDRVDLIEVTFTHHEPVLAEKLTNQLVNNYIHFVSEKVVERLTGSRDFFAGQVQACEQHLAELGQERIAFSAKYGGTMIGQPGALNERIDGLNAELDGLRRGQLIAQRKLDRCRQLVQSVRSKKLVNELRKLKHEREQAILQGHMTDRHPQVQAIQQTIERLENRIKTAPDVAAAEVADDSGPVESGLAIQLVSAESEVDTLTNEVERLEHRLAAYQAVVANSGPILMAYNKIEKQVSNYTELLGQWQGKLRNAQMTLAAEKSKRRTQLNTVQVAHKPYRPAFPRLWPVMAFAIGGGLAFGYVLAFCATSTNHTITSPADAAQLFDAPICGVIDEIEPSRSRIIKTLRRRLFTTVAAVVLLAALGLSGFSVFLKLKHPGAYQKWKAVVTRTPTAQVAVSESASSVNAGSSHQGSTGSGETHGH